MFMHCPKCAHGFCWMCGGTHHVYSCNAFPENQDDATTTTTTPMDDAQRKRNELERYLHYFQRYQGHDVGQKYATKQVLKFHEMETNDNYGGIGENSSVRSLGPKTTKMTKSTRSASALPSSLALSSALSVPVAAGAPSSVIIGSIATLPPKELFDVRMKFKHANEQLLICRRVLKYTYVYVYVYVLFICLFVIIHILFLNCFLFVVPYDPTEYHYCFLSALLDTCLRIINLWRQQQ